MRGRENYPLHAGTGAVNENARGLPMKQLLIGSILLLAGAISAGAAYDGGTQNPFTLGAGARALALSGAYAAVADDVSALFWNPAGLARLDRAEISAMHITLIFGTPYDFLGAAYPLLDWGTFAVGAVRLATDGIPLRDENSYLIGSGEGSFDLREYLLGYGRDLPFGLRAGAVVKLDQERLAGDFASGVGFDLGCQYQYPGQAGGWENLVIGVCVQNAAASPLRLAQEADTLPLLVRAGAAYPVDFASAWRQKLLLSAGIEKTTWQAWRWQAGAEYDAFDLLAVRGGLNSDAWSAGAGFRYAGVALDYALAGQELGLTHRVSLTWRLGASVTEQRLEREKRRQEELDREAGVRAEAAVKTVRMEMEEQMKTTQRKFQKEKQAILAKQQKAVARAVADARQRQQEQHARELEQSYFKSLHYFMGIKDYLAKQYQQAVTEFETVAKYDSNYLELPMWLARARRMAAGRMHAMSETNLSLYYQGIDLYVENRFDEAIQIWKQILVSDSGNLMVLRNIEEAQGRLDAMRRAEKDENRP